MLRDYFLTELIAVENLVASSDLTPCFFNSDIMVQLQLFLPDTLSSSLCFSFLNCGVEFVVSHL